MKNERFLLMGAAGFLLAGAAVSWFGLLSPSAAADPTDTRQVERGARVYGSYCASCHGARLEGQPDWKTRKANGRLPAPPHNATGHTWHHPDAVLFRITRDGIAAVAPAGYQTDMPAFGGALSDEDIWAAVAFIKSSWPAELLRRQQAAGG
jgi:mono/diheme cytochrome c family protein